MSDEMGFREWLVRSCQYGDLLLPMITAFILTIAALWIPVVGLYLSCTIALLVLMALLHRWDREIKSEKPPWYLREEKDAEKAEKRL